MQVVNSGIFEGMGLLGSHLENIVIMNILKFDKAQKCLIKNFISV